MTESQYRRLNDQSYLKLSANLMQALFNRLFPNGTGQAEKEAQKAARALMNALFPKKEVSQPNWAQVPGQQTKSPWRRLDDPAFLKEEQEALKMLFPEGVPQPNQPPPPALLKKLAKEQVRHFQKRDLRTLLKQAGKELGNSSTMRFWRKAARILLPSLYPNGKFTPLSQPLSPLLVPEPSLQNPCYRRLVEEALKMLFPEGVPQPPRTSPPPPNGGFLWQQSLHRKIGNCPGSIVFLSVRQ